MSIFMFLNFYMYVLSLFTTLYVYFIFLSFYKYVPSLFTTLYVYFVYKNYLDLSEVGAWGNSLPTIESMKHMWLVELKVKK